MTSILKSMMATYILEEEVEFEATEQIEVQELEQHHQYPEGFFSSL